MIDSRARGLTHIYLDEKIEGYSNLSVGMLIRALGHDLKIAYIDVQNKSNKFTNLLENLSLSHQFVKSFDRMFIEIYKFQKYDKISKVILPLVEFNTINREIFFNSLKKYDLIIFENMDYNIISEEEIKNILKNKDQMTEFIFIFSDKNDYKKIKKDFDIQTTYEYKSKQTLISNKNIINIGGSGRGKSIYSFGYVVRNFISKKDIKLIFFDKGDDIYGEFVFFDALKNWSKSNKFYGQFDFVQSGAKRYVGPVFRKETIDLDIKEAKEALMLLKTALRKQTPVIADELVTILKNKLLEKEEVIDVLKNVENELLITGDDFIKDIEDMSKQVIEVKNENETKDFGMRIGVDF